MSIVMLRVRIYRFPLFIEPAVPAANASGLPRDQACDMPRFACCAQLGLMPPRSVLSPRGLGSKPVTPVTTSAAGKDDSCSPRRSRLIHLVDPDLRHPVLTDKNQTIWCW